MKSIIFPPPANIDLIAFEALFDHGIEVFGTEESFVAWLNKANFFFDKRAPIEFMNTDAGIEFIDNRLTGLQYGDNA